MRGWYSEELSYQATDVLRIQVIPIAYTAHLYLLMQGNQCSQPTLYIEPAKKIEFLGRKKPAKETGEEVAIFGQIIETGIF